MRYLLCHLTAQNSSRDKQGFCKCCVVEKTTYLEKQYIACYVVFPMIFPYCSFLIGADTAHLLCFVDPHIACMLIIAFCMLFIYAAACVQMLLTHFPQAPRKLLCDILHFNVMWHLPGAFRVTQGRPLRSIKVY